MNIHDKGDPKCPVWVIAEQPYPQDAEKGYLFSGGYGYFWDKMWKQAGLGDYYITCQKPDLEFPNSYRNLINDLNFFKPNIIVPLGNITHLLCPNLAYRNKKTGIFHEVSMDKWAGSILESSALGYPHYIIPNYTPEFAIANYSYRDIQVSIDLGHVFEEWSHYKQFGCLNPLPCRNLLYSQPAHVVLDFMHDCHSYEFTSVDIETIRPARKKSAYASHPGLPYTISLAYDPYNAISFSLWDYSEDENVQIWKELAWLLRNKPQIGQNYFSFDSHYLENLGFEVCLSRCHDTMIRHHILWPECPHSLQFLTKQYSRQPFYKEDGKHWTPKFKDKLMRYNCLDTCITYEVFLGQEKEFEQRPYLRG